MGDEEFQMSNVSGSEIATAWALAAAFLFGLLVFPVAKSIVSGKPDTVAALVASGEVHATRGNVQHESAPKVDSYPLDFAKIAAHNQTALSTR